MKAESEAINQHTPSPFVHRNTSSTNPPQKSLILPTAWSRLCLWHLYMDGICKAAPHTSSLGAISDSVYCKGSNWGSTKSLALIFVPQHFLGLQNSSVPLCPPPRHINQKNVLHAELEWEITAHQKEPHPGAFASI